MYIHMKNKKPFAFAGLWEVWNSADGSEIRSCTIITTQPNSLIETIHNRMPVILADEAYGTWLAVGDQPLELLNTLLVPYPATEMVAYPISRMVNSPQYDTADLIKPID
jgi:putative SOS response-associated peptidase YedK